MRPVGSNNVGRIRVYVQTRPTEVFARIDLFGTDVGVVQKPDEFAGYLAVPRWEDVINRIPVDQRRRYHWRSEDLRFQLVNGVYRAGRQMVQVLARYGFKLERGEKQTLLEIRRLNRELNEAIVGLRYDTVSQHRERISRLVRRVLAKPGMKQPRALQKQELEDILTRLESGQDSLGRANEGALLALTLKAIHLSEERLHQAIMRIEPVVAMRRQMLLSLIAWVEEVLRDVTEFLELVRVPERLRPEDRFQTRRVQHRLWQLAQDLDGIDFQPYLVTARHGAYELRQAASKLGRGETDSFRQTIRTTLMSFRLKENQIIIERLIYRLLLALLRPTERFNWAEQARALAEIENRLEEIDETGFVRPVCREVIRLLRSSRELLEQQNPALLVESRELLKTATDELTGNVSELRR